MDAPAEEPVKGRPDATPCLECGGPTWSHDGYCFKCRSARDASTTAAALPSTSPPASPPATAPPLRAPRLDAAGRIAEEIACRACGYLLHGLDPAGVCPECSTAIERSIHGDLLHFCDPRWLRRVAAGLAVILVGIGGSVVLGLVGAAAVFSIAATGGGGAGMYVVLGSAGVGIAAVLVLGVWWFTTRDPGQMAGGAGDEPTLSARLLARWFVTAQLVAAPLQLVGQTLSGSNPLNPMAATTRNAMTWMLLAMVLSLVAQVGYVAGLVHLRSLVRRIPRNGLGGQLKFVAWAYGATQGCAMLFGVGAVLLMPSIMGGARPSWALVFLGFGGCTVSLSTFVFSVWALVLLIVGRVAIAKVAEDARSRWETAGAG